MAIESHELPGLEVHLDDLVYQAAPHMPPGSQHAFVYYLTIKNGSDREVTFLARKWLIEKSNGEKLVIEGDGIVGERPRLRPGESFSYNSFHLTDADSVARGSFHGVDAEQKPVFVRIPRITMNLPATQ